MTAVAAALEIDLAENIWREVMLMEADVVISEEYVGTNTLINAFLHEHTLSFASVSHD